MSMSSVSSESILLARLETHAHYPGICIYRTLREPLLEGGKGENMNGVDV